jgi:hypothetical protein
MAARALVDRPLVVEFSEDEIPGALGDRRALGQERGKKLVRGVRFKSWWEEWDRRVDDRMDEVWPVSVERNVPHGTHVVG